MQKISQKTVGPVLALALLAGCSTATPYQPLGYGNQQGGYASQQLDQNHFRVMFIGNTLTSRQQVENYLLYRAAELTVQRGSNCFTIVNKDTDQNTEVRMSPFANGYGGGYGGFGYGRGYYPGWSPSWRLGGPWGMYNYNPWSGGPFFPGRYDIDTVTSYQAMADIALSPTCGTAPGSFNAQQVVQNLQPYIMRPQVR
ncbi:hypothetical protein H8M03_11085 [Sphingomonas sabuli]|uniref:DUF4136 domain-containing protein n=1 Tax=Sphingomonas sabuli TaxID=2764186 RepID=A0A7G9L1N6_9SPHN|nr:hypothetical protein [Sphingomonas sabuli]QNM82535.1 hypothetical protein H8M03_11085 [Sphingomonas sabuli]